MNDTDNVQNKLKKVKMICDRLYRDRLYGENQTMGRVGSVGHGWKVRNYYFIQCGPGKFK